MIKDLTNAEYHADLSAVGSSMIRSLLTSPRVYESEYVTRENKREQTPAMLLGSAIHTAILEPELFYEQYVICPTQCSDRRTKLYKEWLLEFGSSGQDVLTETEHDLIQRCRLSVSRNRLATRLLSTEGMIEQSIFWLDKESGVSCKFRADKIAGPFLVDIKTTSACTETEFLYSIEKYRYDVQAAHYLAGASAEFNADFDQFFFIAVETVAPFRCRVFDLTPESLAVGRDDRESALKDLSARHELGDWAEPDEQDVVSLSTKRLMRSRSV